MRKVVNTRIIALNAVHPLVCKAWVSPEKVIQLRRYPRKHLAVYHVQIMVVEWSGFNALDHAGVNHLVAHGRGKRLTVQKHIHAHQSAQGVEQCGGYADDRLS